LQGSTFAPRAAISTPITDSGDARAGVTRASASDEGNLAVQAGVVLHGRPSDEEGCASEGDGHSQKGYSIAWMSYQLCPWRLPRTSQLATMASAEIQGSGRSSPKGPLEWLGKE
jgi:hypothetical protein